MLLAQLPNTLTLLRVGLAAPIAIKLIEGDNGVALILLVIAIGSDFFDGWIARRWNWQSKFGSIADPVADKVLVISLYLTLGSLAHLPWWLVVVVVLRDLLILIGAITYWFSVKRFEGQPTSIGKLYTSLLMGAATLIIADLNWPFLAAGFYQAISIIIVVFCSVSTAQYGRLAWLGIKRKPLATRSNDD